MAHCRSCNAEVYWLAHIDTGKLAPIDARADQAGNIVREGADRYRMLTKAEREAGPSLNLFGDEVPRYVNHFATCPDRAGWHKEPVEAPDDVKERWSR